MEKNSVHYSAYIFYPGLHIIDVTIVRKMNGRKKIRLVSEMWGFLKNVRQSA
jgi:hypothetical protein